MIGNVYSFISTYEVGSQKYSHFGGYAPSPELGLKNWKVSQNLHEQMFSIYNAYLLLLIVPILENKKMMPTNDITLLETENSCAQCLFYICTFDILCIGKDVLSP